MRRQIQGYFYLASAMVLVGSTVIASKLIAAGLPPFTATAFRFAVALPVFLILMRLNKAALPRLSRHDWGILILQAGAGSVGYTTLLISGLHFASAADAGVIIGTLPVVAAAISITLLGERPRFFQLAAIGLAAIGIFIITFQGDADHARSWLGNALILAAVCCEGFFILLNKRLQVQLPPLTLSTLMTGLGLSVAIGPALAEQPWQLTLTGQATAAVIYYALVPTVGGFLLWYAGAAKVSGTEASLFTALAPASAVLLAWATLGEPVGVPQMAGICCVLLAVLCLSLGLGKGRSSGEQVQPDRMPQG